MKRDCSAAVQEGKVAEGVGKLLLSSRNPANQLGKARLYHRTTCWGTVHQG